jgi:hypothetical protein
MTKRNGSKKRGKKNRQQFHDNLTQVFTLNKFAEDVAVEKGGDQGAKKDCGQVTKKEVDQKAMKEVKEELRKTYPLDLLKP